MANKFYRFAESALERAEEAGERKREHAIRLGDLKRQGEMALRERQELGSTRRTGMEQAGQSERERLADVAESQRQQAGFGQIRMTPTYKTGQAQYLSAQYGTTARGMASSVLELDPETGEMKMPEWVQRIKARHLPQFLSGDAKKATKSFEAELAKSVSYMDKWLTPENKALIAEKSGLTVEALAILDKKTPEAARIAERLMGDISAGEKEHLAGSLAGIGERVARRETPIFPRTVREEETPSLPWRESLVGRGLRAVEESPLGRAYKSLKERQTEAARRRRYVGPTGF